MRPSGVTTGLSMAAASSRSAIVAACSTVSRGGGGGGEEKRGKEEGLDARVFRAAVARDDRAAVEQCAQVGGRAPLADLRAQLLEVGGEHAVGAEKPLDAQSARDIRDLHERPEIQRREHEHPEHPIGAVDQRKTLFLIQLQRLDAVALERLRGRADVSRRVIDGPLAHERERAVGERREVAGAAE
jgi:hypothetical protein